MTRKTRPLLRILADKISIAVRIDYFKGQFKGDALLEEARKKIAQ